MTRGLAVLALLTLLAGCVSTGAPTLTKTNAAPLPLADPFHPAAARGGPATELSAPKALADVVVGQPGFAEPNVAPAFDGHTVYVGNPGSTWRSTDRGKSWTHGSGCWPNWPMCPLNSGSRSTNSSSVSSGEHTSCCSGGSCIPTPARIATAAAIR